MNNASPTGRNPRATLSASIKRIAAITAALYAGACAVTASGCFINAMMFHPPRPGYSWQSPDIIKLRADTLTLAALWLPHPEAKKTILYFHGNAEDVENTRFILSRLHQGGVSVLAVDYPGYGMSEGSPSEQALYASADAAMDYLAHTAHVAPSNVIALGVSIGSGPACYLAEKHPDLGGLILQSAFTSAILLVTHVRLFPIDPFPNMARMRNIKCPKLFIHGTADAVVPFDHSVRLHQRAREPKTLIAIPEAGHNDLIHRMGLTRYTQTILQFAESGWN